MNRKNYYQTLGIAPSASHQEVKLTFRKLALLYHPDRNPGNEQAADRFREVQEAYEILGNHDKRKRYDREYWLNVPGNAPLAPTTPLSVLKESIRLRQYVSGVNIFSLDHEALNFHLLRILSGENIALLLEYQNEKLNEQVIRELVKASEVLRFGYMGRIISQLKKLAAAQPEKLLIIRQYEKTRIRSDYSDRYSPFLVLIIVILLCWLIYLYGK